MQTDDEIAKELTLAMLPRLTTKMVKDDKGKESVDIEATAQSVGTLYRQLLKAVKAGPAA